MELRLEIGLALAEILHRKIRRRFFITKIPFLILSLIHI